MGFPSPFRKRGGQWLKNRNFWYNVINLQTAFLATTEEDSKRKSKILKESAKYFEWGHKGHVGGDPSEDLFPSYVTPKGYRLRQSLQGIYKEIFIIF